MTNRFSGKKQRLQPVKTAFDGDQVTIDAGFDRLRCAILRQAVTDYTKALKKDKAAQICALERFFLSSWGQLLSDDHGELIIDMVKRKVKKRAP